MPETEITLPRPCRRHSDDGVTRLLEAERAKATSQVEVAAGSDLDLVRTCPCWACRFLRGEITE